MLSAVHCVVYAEDPEAARTFFREVVGWPFVDAHDGWLIFRSGPSELGIHPAGGDGTGATPPHHEISFLCDDLEATMAELAAKGARFEGGIDVRGFGRTATMVVPGAGTVLVYEPRHPLAHDLA
ncbi:MAG TPA: VOC family protein [Acidimicrobiales bacterium]|nr:VOC family protein [Acidimicrobiales bacterium]